MSLLEDAAAVGDTKIVNPCSMQKLKAADPAFHAEVIEAIESDIPVTWIVQATTDRGKSLSETVLGRHRRGHCSQCKETN